MLWLRQRPVARPVIVTPSHTRRMRMHLRKNQSKPGRGVTTLRMSPVVGVIPSAINALNGPAPSLEHALLARHVVYLRLSTKTLPRCRGGFMGCP